MRSVVLAAPGRLDQRTGGYIYNRRMLDGLRAYGWSAGVLQLDGSFPHPTTTALAEADLALASVRPGTVLIVDSLALGAMADLVERESRRVPLVAFMHLPLSAGVRHAGADDAISTNECRALHAAALVVMTGHATQRLLAPCNLLPRRQLVIEPGTDRRPATNGTEANRPRREGDESPVQLLCVATVNDVKDHETLLRALASIPSSSWHLTCAGSLTRDLVTVERVRAMIASLGLESRVTLAGELEEPALDACFRRTDLFVLATRQETYGMAVAEAIAHGLPVVSTDTGAIADIVGPEGGLLVPVGNLLALADALRCAVENESLRAHLAEGARRASLRLPTWDAAVNRLVVALEPLTHG